MNKRVEIGRRWDGDFGVRISAPGEDVEGGRLLFSSDASFVQVVDRLNVSLAVSAWTITEQGPPGTGLPGTTFRYILGYASFVFPATMPWPPALEITYRYLSDGANHFRPIGTSDGVIRYAPTASGAEIWFYTGRNEHYWSFGNVSAMVARVNILNQPAQP